ncbi:SAM-dependent methyltransferase [Amycolatopsis sp. NPDC004079]|uniref:SAM-dependent methyltransferase n=1 Tax=Amycolatopsis sp. NPDC004079 TaxID=3154549 RepID=UPI0033B6A8ED
MRRSATAAAEDTNAPAPSASPAELYADAARWRPPATDLDHPSLGRVEDHALGGDASWAIDRLWYQEAVRAVPYLPLAFRIAHGFVGRAFDTAYSAGIRRFLLVGDALPYRNAVVARALAFPGSRVVHAGRDRCSKAHWTCFAQQQRAPIEWVTSDFAVPGTILYAEPTRRLLNDGDPVGLVLANALETVHDTDAATAALRACTDRLPPGSMVIAAHPSTDGLDPGERDLAERMHELYEDDGPAPQPPGFLRPPRRRLRTAEEFARLLDGLDLLPPGIVHADDWHNPRPTFHDPAYSLCLAAVAALPERRPSTGPAGTAA